MKKVLLVFSVIVFLIYLFGNINAMNRKGPEQKVVKPEILNIKITGEVLNPGTYQVLLSSTVGLAIDLAGRTSDSVYYPENKLLTKSEEISVLKRISRYSLSTMTEEELIKLKLPGIGPKKLEKILEKQKETFYSDWDSFKKDLRLNEKDLLQIILRTVLN